MPVTETITIKQMSINTFTVDNNTWKLYLHSNFRRTYVVLKHSHLIANDMLQ